MAERIYPRSILVLSLLLAGCGDDAQGNDNNNHSPFPVCGNGVLEDGESCDGSALGDESCESLGHAPGRLRCSPACELDVTACGVADGCGNGLREPTEACDGTDLAGQSCTSLGLGTGELRCSAECTLDPSGCVPLPAHCGNGALDPDEICDGDQSRVPDCQHQGFDGGALGCTADCQLDLSGCHVCGNGTREATEICDDQNNVGGDGCSADCLSLETCGNAIVDTAAGEDCEDGDLQGQSCASLGFASGTLDCTQSCRFDTSGCQSCGNGRCETGETPSSCPGDCLLVDVSVGYGYTCVLHAGGAARCWGNNLWGTLGDGTTTDRLHPVTVQGVPPLEAVAAGLLHTCTLDALGQVWCWGRGGQGQLGDGAATNSAVAVPVSTLNDATAIAVGSLFGCAVRADGTVACWGDNQQGQLGDGTNADRSTPVTVSGIQDAVGIAAGSDHACAVLATGEVRCWGLGDDGRLGDGTGVSSNTPVMASGLTDAQQVSCGASSSCARTSNGEVWCWGENTFGQLCDSTTFSRPQPVSTLLPSGTLALSTETGGSHGCAIQANATAVCWGYNFYGQLGDGTDTDRSTPVAVSGLTGLTQVSAAFDHSCALEGQHTLWCWGANGDGQLGDLTQTDRWTPVAAQLW